MNPLCIIFVGKNSRFEKKIVKNVWNGATLERRNTRVAQDGKTIAMRTNRHLMGDGTYGQYPCHHTRPLWHLRVMDR